MAVEKSLNNWFKHDSNAKDDFKCMLIIEQLGCEGYGIFWILVETLRDQKDYRYPIRLVSPLARKYNTTEAKILTVIKEYGLFDIDDDSFFFSYSLNRRMEAFDTIVEKRKIAGIKSGESRRLKAIEHKSNTCSTDVERLDKNKEEKIKKEVTKLKNFLSTKTANGILVISKNKSYQSFFSEAICDFIEQNGGLTKVKALVEDDNYDAWIIDEILKSQRRIHGMQ